MNKIFIFEYSGWEDKDYSYQSQDYPTLEEAKMAAAELKEQGYTPGEIEELRV